MTKSSAWEIPRARPSCEQGPGPLTGPSPFAHEYHAPRSVRQHCFNPLPFEREVTQKLPYAEQACAAIAKKAGLEWWGRRTDGGAGGDRTLDPGCKPPALMPSHRPTLRRGLDPPDVCQTPARSWGSGGRFSLARTVAGVLWLCQVQWVSRPKQVTTLNGSGRVAPETGGGSRR